MVIADQPLDIASPGGGPDALPNVLGKSGMCLIKLCCCFALIPIVALGPWLNYASQQKIHEAIELAPVA